ncbi:MAG: tetratricopeptide repeat protein, partial [Gemmatimonadetes bacterium]|nr:tetratricopeptide repeat protein [Gemmatimonadota bacterium]
MRNRRERLSLFLRELQRRHVYRVSIAYGVAAFVMGQIAELVLPAFGLEALLDVVIVLLLIGLPVTAVLAWAFDITPQGVQRTAPLEPARGAAAVDAGDESRGTGATATRNAAPRVEPPAGSIAALPFSNRSDNPAWDYFSDGLTEELIGMLSRVPGLHVAARSSSFALKNTALDALQAGRRLGVRHIVEGGVRIAGQRVRMTVQVVDTRTGFATWSEQFDRELTDIFAIQREIAHAIVERVASDAGAARASLERRTTDQFEALKLYLQGRYCCNRRTEVDLQRAIDFFDRALEVDPDYALAHAGLADTYSILLDYGFISTTDALQHARASAEQALRLDPSAAETYTSLALVRQFEWRWTEAEEAFETSLRLNTDYAVAHQRYALHLAWRRRYDGALDHAVAAERLDPLSPATSATVGWILYYARRYDDAIRKLEQVVAREPQFATARVALGRALLMSGRREASIAQHEQAARDSGRAAS